MRPMMNASNAAPGAFMSIGEASRRSGFTIKALRFYERCGILPTSTRRANGYRLYGETDLHRLSFIRDAKALGLTLRAIGDIVRASNGNRRKRLLGVLDDRIADATDRIAGLTLLRDELERRRRAVAQGRPSKRNRRYCSCLKKSEPTG
jgi:MerR family transcriptional regulator, copper efflux regulator